MARSTVPFPGTSASLRLAARRMLGLASFACVLAHAQTTVPGKIPGEFSVSPSGAAVYRIPIQVPPGIAGMEPKLALVYNSQAGNGIMGMGWSLEGLSAITRCPKSMATDGVRAAITHTPEDRFCLDGQRLINVAGAYGAAGSEYRTEIDSFSKVIANGAAAGNAANGPESFTVKTKAGLTLEYGNTADSRIEAQGKAVVRVWALSKMRDAKGNEITYAYTEDNANGEYRIGTATYALDRKIVFTYDDRPDKFLGYEAGSRIRQSVRIKSVNSYIQQALFQAGDIFYVQSDGISKSTPLSIRLCTDSARLLCKNSLNIQSTEGVAGFDSTIPMDVRTWDNSNIRNIAEDFNGDGRSDLLVWHAPFNNYQYNLYLSNGLGFNPATPTGVKSWDNPKLNNQVVGDFDGDGLIDLLMWHAPFNNYRFNLYRNNGGGFDPAIATDIRTWDNSSIRNIAADFNGDGRTDFLVWHAPFNNHQYNLYLSNGAGFNPATPTGVKSWDNPKLNNQVVGDFDGDGLIDLLMWHTPFNNYRFNLYRNNGGGFDPAIATDIRTWDNSSIRNIAADFNGDGRTDFLVWHAPLNNHQYNLYLSNGAGFNPATPTGVKSWDNPKLNNQVVGDFDGDGLVDLLMWHVPFNNYRFNLYRNNGGGFDPAIATDIRTWDNSNIGNIAADFNGDGRTDFLVWHAPFNNFRYNISYANPRSPTLLESISSNLEEVIRVDFSSLTEDAVYLKDETSAYPRADLRVPAQVVSSVLQSNGAGGVNTTTYSYGGLKAEHASVKPEHAGSGRGMLGFRWMKSREESTGIETYTEFSQQWPHTGQVLKSETRLVKDGVNQLLKRSVNTPACYQSEAPAGVAKPAATAPCTPWAKERVYFPFVASSNEESWDLNGAQMPTLFSQSLYGGYADQSGTARQFGDPTQITVDIREGTVLKHRKVTTNQYRPAKTDGANWESGRLNRASVTSSQY